MIVGTKNKIQNSPSYVICDETIYYEAKIDEFGVYHTEIGEFRETGIPRLFEVVVGGCGQGDA